MHDVLEENLNLHVRIERYMQIKRSPSTLLVIYTRTCTCVVHILPIQKYVHACVRIVCSLIKGEKREKNLQTEKCRSSIFR